MAAATNTKQKQQQPAPAGGEPVVVDPKFEWAEKAGGYVLRITLQGFRKGDFRVQVDGAGRLTVSGARPGTTPGSLHKVFQLPSTASLDDIAGRFEAGVLTLTVPKCPYSGVPAPTSIEEIKRNKPGVAKDDGASSTPAVTPPASKDVAGDEKKAASGDESMKPKTKPKEEIAKQEDVSKKAMDEATKKAQQQKQQEEASNHKKEQQKLAPEPEVKKEQEVKPEAPQAAPEKPAPEPEVAIGENAKAVIDQDSLAAVVRRCSEEEKAKAAAAAMEAKAVLEKKATACSGWKERAAGGLEQLTDMKWADNVVEKARNNKEVIAIAIAAFSVSFFVSQKLFRK